MLMQNCDMLKIDVGPGKILNIIHNIKRYLSGGNVLPPLNYMAFDIFGAHMINVLILYQFVKCAHIQGFCRE